MNKYVRDVVTFPHDAHAAWRHARVPGVLREMRIRTLDRFLRSGVGVVLEQALADVPPIALPQGIRITEFAGPDWSAFRETVSEVRIAAFRERIARGRSCLVAWRGDAVAGFTWTSLRVDRDLERYPMPLPPDSVYGWDLFVDSAERGRGVGTALVHARLMLARERGFRRSWRIIEIDNLATRQTVLRTAGESMRVVGEVRFRKFGRRFWGSFSAALAHPEALRIRQELEHAR